MSQNSTKYIYIIIKRAKHLGRSNKIKFLQESLYETTEVRLHRHHLGPRYLDKGIAVTE